MNHPCKHCGSKNVVKKGKETRVDGDTYQRILCKDCNTNSYWGLADSELVEHNQQLSKQKQKLQDSNRIERKSGREFYRMINALEEYSKSLIEVFKDQRLLFKTKVHQINTKYIGLAHITDTHFNELVNLMNNQYDFNVAAKRLQNYVYQATIYLKSLGVTELVLGMTGDLMNSDRRLDELLAQSTNRSKATFLAVQLLMNMILDFNRNFNITVVSVSGNESRVSGKEVGWVNVVASDTYDTTIHNILYMLLKDRQGINIIPDCPLEQVIELNGQNVLLIHGHQFRNKPGEAVSKKVRQYADKGVIISMVLFGHIHEALIADLYARGSSLVGANAYSENALSLTSRASQNLHLFSKDSINSLKIDLQNSDDFDGYPVQKELEAYNAKSADKAKQGTTIFKIVI